MNLRFLAPLLAAIALPFGLAGCFLSEQPLIPASDGYAPYAELEFHESDGDDVVRLARDGTIYRGSGDGGAVEITFKQIEDGLLVAQMKDAAEERYLYGLLRIDEASGTARAYAALSRGTDNEIVPGMERCENLVCVSSLDAYIAHAKAVEAASPEPELTYVFKGTP